MRQLRPKRNGELKHGKESGVQVEELYALDPSLIETIKPIYAFIFVSAGSIPSKGVIVGIYLSKRLATAFQMARRFERTAADRFTENSTQRTLLCAANNHKCLCDDRLVECGHEYARTDWPGA